MLSPCAAKYVQIVTGMPFSDPTGGFKCFRRPALQSIDLQAVGSNGYSFQIEMSHKVWRQGMKIVEVPIIFTDRYQGTSKMSRTIVWEALWMVWRLLIQNGFRRAPRTKPNPVSQRSTAKAYGAKRNTNWLKSRSPAVTIPTMQSVFTGAIYVVRDNIDTDQIIPAQFLNLIPTIEEEYISSAATLVRLARFALSDALREGWPARQRISHCRRGPELRLRQFARACSDRPGFGRLQGGSGGEFRAHFFRNCVATGELYPCECIDRLCDVLKTGDVITVDLDAC